VKPECCAADRDDHHAGAERESAQAAGAKGVESALSEGGSDHRCRGVHERASCAVGGEVERVEGDVGVEREPHAAGGERKRDGRRRGRHQGSHRRRPRNETPRGVERGDVPRFDDLHLRHDPVREPRRGREVRQVFEHVHDLPRPGQTGLAVLAGIDVSLKRGHAKADLAV